MRNYKSLIIFLGLGHGLNDMVAGYFLGSLLLLKLDILQISFGLLLYNLLAFGGQYPVALILEKANSPRKFLLLSYALNIAAIALFTPAPQLSIILAGVASAIYHVAGGTVCARENKATHIGFFAAPGVAGLILGGYFAYAQTEILWVLLAAAVIFFFIISGLRIGNKRPSEENTSLSDKKIPLDRHDLIMILLLTVISLRSMIWNIFQLLHENNYEWLLAIAASAFIGKIAGGWLADRIGWRLYLYITLVTSTPLITFFRKEIILFCIGIGLLQSGIPATTSLLIRSMKGKTERSIGLSFGTMIMAGAIVFYTPARVLLVSNYILCSITALMLILLFVAGLKSKTANLSS